MKPQPSKPQTVRRTTVFNILESQAKMPDAPPKTPAEQLHDVVALFEADDPEIERRRQRGEPPSVEVIPPPPPRPKALGLPMRQARLYEMESRLHRLREQRTEKTTAITALETRIAKGNDWLAAPPAQAGPPEIAKARALKTRLESERAQIEGEAVRIDKEIALLEEEYIAQLDEYEQAIEQARASGQNVDPFVLHPDVPGPHSTTTTEA